MQNFNSKLKIDIKVRCYKLSITVIKLAEASNSSISNKIILHQLIRSITSIGANLVEGSSASSRREFKKFYEISLKSASESKYWLGLLRDTNVSLTVQITPILKEVAEICNILSASILTLKKH